MIETVLDEEERGTRRKEGQGGRSDEEEEASRRVEKVTKIRNEKVA